MYSTSESAHPPWYTNPIFGIPYQSGSSFIGNKIRRFANPIPFYCTNHNLFLHSYNIPFFFLPLNLWVTVYFMSKWGKTEYLSIIWLWTYCSVRLSSQLSSQFAKYSTPLSVTFFYFIIISSIMMWTLLSKDDHFIIQVNIITIFCRFLLSISSKSSKYHSSFMITIPTFTSALQNPCTSTIEKSFQIIFLFQSIVFILIVYFFPYIALSVIVISLALSVSIASSLESSHKL